MSTLSALDIRRRLGRKEWGVPAPFGPDGWYIDRLDKTARMIVTAWDEDDCDWVHASISRPDQTPSYEDLTKMHAAVWPGGYAYQVFVPPSAHINIHPNALHLWGRSDGKNVLPEFGRFGTI